MISKTQLRNFILLKQGLLGKKRFLGKDGIMDYIRQAGCIQFDPVNVCGRNADLTLQSRIDKYDEKQLDELLYTDRKLIDYWDKNMSIIPMEDWPCFRFYPWYQVYDPDIMALIHSKKDEIFEAIHKAGSLTTKTLDLPGQTVRWFWMDVRLAKAALETLYNERELVIHHKSGVVKSYALASDTLPKEIFNTQNPFNNATEERTWRINRRIGAVGCLWNRRSDAFLLIPDCTAENRNESFRLLEESHQIERIHVEGLKDDLFLQSSDLDLLHEAIQLESIPDRVEFIAPLDPFLWDRKLIKEIFDFDYTWEIYTPVNKRVYGYYTLPVLYRNQLIGRIEMTCDRKQKALHLHHFYPENTYKSTKAATKAFQDAIKRFAEFNHCTSIVKEETWNEEK